MEPVARKTAGFRVSVQLSQLGAGNRQKTRCAYQCEIAPWQPSLLVVSRPCSLAASGSQRATAAAKSAHENAISGPCMRFWRGSSPWSDIFFDLVRRTPIDSITVACNRRDAIGGWAMGRLAELDLYSHLLCEACLAMPKPDGGAVTIAPDGG